MQNRFSLNKISEEQSFSFDPIEYSKFKFGDDIIAERYGKALAESYITNYLSKNPTSKQIVVISSPYSFIPTATYAMKKYFVFELNKWLADNDYLVSQETKIHRSITYKEDYGELSKEDRLKLICNDRFEIDAVFVKDKFLIFLDDIKITGSHEKMIMNMIDNYSLKNDLSLLYFAELTNTNIQPQIENYLNYSYVKSISDLDKIINGERFAINTRIVKYLLSHDKQAFNNFIKSQKIEFTELFFNMALGNNYHNITEYKDNLNLTKNILSIKNNQQAYGY